jgi:hypothetical protein
LISLNCHCGNIQIKINKLVDSLTSCNCSICNRYGTLWGYYKPEDVLIDNDDKSIIYSYGDKNIEFYFCKKCGCVTHYLTTKKVKDSKVGINFRMANIKDIDSIKIRKFDGADTWKFID